VNVRPVAAALFSAAEVRPFLLNAAARSPLPVHPAASLNPPTLLRLGCALTT
jgi:hypothetical protein